MATTAQKTAFAIAGLGGVGMLAFYFYKRRQAANAVTACVPDGSPSITGDGTDCCSDLWDGIALCGAPPPGLNTPPPSVPATPAQTPQAASLPSANRAVAAAHGLGVRYVAIGPIGPTGSTGQPSGPQGGVKALPGQTSAGVKAVPGRFF